MICLLVVDMQTGLFSESTPRHDSDGVVRRINDLSAAVRESGGFVIFIQHDGTREDGLYPGTPGWEILPDLERTPADMIIRKTACDAFYRTNLDKTLKQHLCNKLIITGCATDFCVDTTIRSAAGRDYDIYVPADAHTTGDRPHSGAATIIAHHNWVWGNLIAPGSEIEVLPAGDILARLKAAS